MKEEKKMETPSASPSQSTSTSTSTLSDSKRRDKKREISWSEFKSRSSAKTNPKNQKQWIVIRNQVYDIAKFAPNHPGGSVISKYIGRDATDEFEAFHLPRVLKSRLPAYHIGSLKDVDADAEKPKVLPITTDYRKLKMELWKNGWFDADLYYYLQKDILALTILCMGILCILQGTSVFARTILGGSLVGLALQQIAFVAHDAGHRGISPPKPGGGINWLGWIHGSIGFGVSIEMWVDEHSGHHAMTMRPHEDPQFKYLPIFLVSQKELDTFDKLSNVEQVLAKWFVPFQHYTLIPISVIIGRFNLHIISLIYALKAKKLYDVAGLALYFMWFGSIVSYLPIKERVPFVFVAYIVAGILHIQLTISHLATDSFTAEEDEKEQFFAFQCKTTRNIDTSWYDDWFHGGLQYQIEHHLFPQMPRHYLPKVKPLVEQLCKKHDVPYRSTSFTKAVGECLSDFRRLSRFMEDLVHPHEIMAE